MARFNPFKFLQEVRAETNKVTWPSRRETAITTVMVFVMSALASIFFLLADQVIRVGVTGVLDPNFLNTLQQYWPYLIGALALIYLGWSLRGKIRGLW